MILTLTMLCMNTLFTLNLAAVRGFSHWILMIILVLVNSCFTPLMLGTSSPMGVSMARPMLWPAL